MGATDLVAPIAPRALTLLHRQRVLEVEVTGIFGERCRGRTDTTAVAEVVIGKRFVERAHTTLVIQQPVRDEERWIAAVIRHLVDLANDSLERKRLALTKRDDPFSEFRVSIEIVGQGVVRARHHRVEPTEVCKIERLVAGRLNPRALDPVVRGWIHSPRAAITGDGATTVQTANARRLARTPQAQPLAPRTRWNASREATASLPSNRERR
ncbi:MAG: hypothetical protein ACI8TX_001908 [Hyphomicrobiaceae bacterium]|jgi:hypothetical protein